MDWWAGMNSCGNGANADVSQIEASIFDPWINCDDLDLGSILNQASSHQPLTHHHLHHHPHHHHQQQQQQLHHHHQQQQQQQQHQQHQHILQQTPSNQILLATGYNHHHPTNGLVTVADGSPASSVTSGSNSSADTHLTHFTGQQLVQVCSDVVSSAGPLTTTTTSSSSTNKQQNNNIFNIITNSSHHNHNHHLSYLQQQQEVQTSAQYETLNGQSCSSSTGSSSSVASSVESSPLNSQVNNNTGTYLSSGSPNSSSPIHHHHLLLNSQTASSSSLLTSEEDEQQQQLILAGHLSARSQTHLNSKQIILKQQLTDCQLVAAVTDYTDNLHLLNNSACNRRVNVDTNEDDDDHDQNKEEDQSSNANDINNTTTSHILAQSHDLHVHHQVLLNETSNSIESTSTSTSTSAPNSNNNVSSIDSKTNIANVLHLSQQPQQIGDTTNCDIITTTTNTTNNTKTNDYDEQQHNNNSNEHSLLSSHDDHLVVVYSQAQPNINISPQTSPPLSSSQTLAHQNTSTPVGSPVGADLCGTTSNNQKYRSEQQQAIVNTKSKSYSKSPGSSNQTNVQKIRRCRHITDYVLAEEEKRLLIKEGYTDFPMTCQARPLSKTEERILRKIRRKIRNKKSAQCSRQRKKEYVEDLERKYAAVIRENEELKQVLDRIQQLQQHHTINGTSFNLDWKDLFSSSKLSQASDIPQTHTLYN